ncbi:MAG: hypothetical protein R3F59_38120 [Myxococcota bacterium]
MSRAKAATIPVPTTVHEWQAVARRLVPLWRHGVWLVALFALLTLWVDIRVDVQQLRSDLDRTNRAHREAQIQRERLRLELDARRRSSALEGLASSLDLAPGAEVVVVRPQEPADVPSGRLADLTARVP